MSCTFEALNAAEGDCLLLHHGPANARRHVVIDGGPRATWACALRPRLIALRAEHGLGDDEPLPIELLVVSHIDNDHIQGIAAMLDELSRDRAGAPWKLAGLWCNTFDDQAATDDVAALAQLDAGGAAGVAEGRAVRDLATALAIPRNGPRRLFPTGFVARAASAPQLTLGELTLTVLSPSVDELTKLQAEWDKYLRAPAAKLARGGAAAATKDTSAPNLSSIIVLAEADGHRVLLPGDARADQIRAGLARAGLLPDGGRCEVDVFKLPHHGSIRNVDAELFDRVRARHYVISANGTNGNPDEPTLALLERVLDRDQAIWLTFPRDAWKQIKGTSARDRERVAALQRTQRWLDRQQVKVVYRAPDALGITIPLDAKARPAAPRKPRQAPRKPRQAPRAHAPK